MIQVFYFLEKLTCTKEYQLPLAQDMNIIPNNFFLCFHLLWSEIKNQTHEEIINISNIAMQRLSKAVSLLCSTGYSSHASNKQKMATLPYTLC